jgi:hypothetical protein
MTKLLMGFAILPFLANMAIADQPTPLTDAQMDLISAGAAVAGSGPGASNASVVASSTNGVTAGGGAGLNAGTFSNAGSGTAAAVFGIPGAGSVTVAGAAP